MSWMAFVEGFARTATDIIGERKEEAQEYKDRMREMAERNRSKITAMDKAVENNQMLIQQAKNLYATDEMITMALDADPVNGLSGMVQTLRGLQANPDIGANYTPEFVKNRYIVPDDIVANLDVMSRFGASDFTPGDTVAPQSSFLQSITARDAMTQAYSALDQEMLPGTQYSIFDASGITEADLVKPKPGAFLQYVEPSFMSREMAEREADDYQRMVAETTRLALAVREAAEKNAALLLQADSNFSEADRDAAITAANNTYNQTITQAKQRFINARGRDRIGYAAQLSPYFVNDPVALEALRDLGLTEEAVVGEAAPTTTTTTFDFVGLPGEDEAGVEVTMEFIDAETGEVGQSTVTLKEDGSAVYANGQGATAEQLQELITEGRVRITDSNGIVYTGGGSLAIGEDVVQVEGYEGTFLRSGNGALYQTGPDADGFFISPQQARQLEKDGKVSYATQAPAVTGPDTLAEDSERVIELLRVLGNDISVLPEGEGIRRLGSVATPGSLDLKLQQMFAEDPNLEGLKHLRALAETQPEFFRSTYDSDTLRAIRALTPDKLIQALSNTVIGDRMERAEGRGSEGYSLEDVSHKFQVSRLSRSMLARLMMENGINPNYNRDGAVLADIDRDVLREQLESSDYVIEAQAEGLAPPTDVIIDILLEKKLPRLHTYDTEGYF